MPQKIRDSLAYCYLVLMKRTALALTLMLTFLFAAVAGVQFANVVEANFFMPPADTVLEIEYPRNVTYDTNTIELRFSVETNLGVLYFYSLDGQERREANTTTVSQVPLPEYPPFIDGTLWTRRTEHGIVLLPNLSKGAHTVTIYQIYPLSHETPQDGNVIASTTVTFDISTDPPLQSPSPAPSPTPTPSPTPSPSPSPQETEPEPFPPTLVFTFVVSIPVVGLGLLVYFKKRHH